MTNLTNLYVGTYVFLMFLVIISLKSKVKLYKLKVQPIIGKVSRFS